MADAKSPAPIAGSKPVASQPPASAPPGSPAAAPAAPPVNDDAARKEVLRLLRGPIAQVYKTLLPALATSEDPYKTVMANYELLDAALKLFQAKRDAFAAFLVDGKGVPVVDDSVRLVCGRSVNEVVGMVVRSGMRHFAEQHFGRTAAAAAMAAKIGGESPRQRWIASIAAVFHKKSGAPRRTAPAAADIFYKSIRDSLDFAWQVPYFPIYVEMPPSLFNQMGASVTRLDSLEKLQRLALLANDDIAKAVQVINDLGVSDEMLCNNVLAAASVSQMSTEGFNMVNDALAHLDVRKKWDVFANTVTALQLTADKRISKADIAAMAEHLDILNQHALNAIFDLKLGRDQIGAFLATAEQALTRPVFLALFGPFPDVIADDAAAVEKQKAFTQYVQSSLRGLVQAVQQLEVKFKRDDPKAVNEALSLVCEARRDNIATEVKKLAPAPIGPL